MDQTQTHISSHKPLLNHIGDFLDYCASEGLKVRTQINYQRYLKKFTEWLQVNQLNSLLPYQLTQDHIQSYVLYLSKPQGSKNRQILKKSTQNYYLIALRAFLGYFSAKGILSIPPDKITLPGGNKGFKSQIYPNLDQLNALLNNFKGSNVIILRNRAIIYTIVFTGLKIGKITHLNRHSIKDLPSEILPFIEEYLRTRDDQEQALFINYGGRKNASRRLTGRTIQNLIRRSGKSIGLSPMTPETLRFARIMANWNKAIEIKNTSWQQAERTINDTISHLKENISVLEGRYKSQTPLANIIPCDDCIIRKVAILIVAGTVTYEKIPVQKMWPGFYFDSRERKLIRHGKDWHRKMLDSVAQYNRGTQEVILEPHLHYGRADIAIRKNHQSVYIEIGTVSLFKIWYNLMTMKNVAFLLVPNEDYVIKMQN